MCLSCLSWYGRHVAPHIVHIGCSTQPFQHMRRRMIPKATGVVVEVGFGSGLNLPYYDAAKVSRLVGVDPDATMLALAERRSHSTAFAVEQIRASAERMPVDTGFADTVVVSYALCTIPDVRTALAEIRRVLKPSGNLVFIEHGRAEQPYRRQWQRRLTGPWGCLLGGCRLDRDPLHAIQAAGFAIIERQSDRFPLSFWLLGSHHAGVATPSAS